PLENGGQVGRAGGRVTGLRGAAPVPASPPATAPAPRHLRDLAPDRRRDHRLLPRFARRRDSGPRQGAPLAGLDRRRRAPAAEREAARAPASDRAYPQPDP